MAPEATEEVETLAALEAQEALAKEEPTVVVEVLPPEAHTAVNPTALSSAREYLGTIFSLPMASSRPLRW